MKIVIFLKTARYSTPKRLLQTIVLSFVMLASTGTVMAQGWTSSGSNTTTTNNVGINSTPVSGYKLSVGGDVALTNTSPTAWRNITGQTTQGGLQLAANVGSGNGSSIELYGSASSGREGQARIISYGPTTTGGGIQFLNFDPTTIIWKTHMRILSNGKVCIGDYKPTSPFADYKLAVDGTVVCKRAVVQTNSWADFVFKQDYQLPNLEEVEQYIKTNKHLPDVPSEKAVLEGGIDVSEMNKILLQKVEELTLYMIALKKENVEMKTAIVNLQNQ